MTILLLAHAIVAIAVIAAGDRLGRAAFAVAGLPALATVLWALTKAGAVLDGEVVTESVTWVSALDLSFRLRLDGFGLTMLALVSGIGVLVFVYAIGYFSHPKPGTARLAGLLCLFSGAMLGVVLADHLLALFVFWELTSVSSYLLIGNNDRDARARAAALQAILITGAGGLVMLLGFVIVGESAGTYQISALVASPPSGAAVTGGLVCILIGAFTKSAQVPFNSWLPGAMVAPTPISAYLHSATMVKAGVYLVGLLAPAFAHATGWRPLVVVVGLTTMLVGGARALRQHDLKLLLAMGTISQLGFLVVLLGIGVPAVAQAGVAMLVAHAAFKAALFMVVGIVDHEVGTRDVRLLTGFGRGWWPTVVVGVVGAASMAGLPPLFGFVAKEKALDALGHAGEKMAGAGWVLALVVLGSILTFAYSARFVLGLLGRLHQPVAEAAEPDRTIDSRQAHAPAAVFAGPAVVLTAVTVLLGLAPGLVNQLVQSATTSLYPGYAPKDLVLWAGFNQAVVLSAVIVAAGLALLAARRPVERIQARFAGVPGSDRGYLASLRGLNWLADRTTSVMQSGSLPLYAGIILTTAAVVPGVVLLTDVDLPALPRFVEAPVQLVLVSIMLVGALATCLAHRRFAAALLLGAVGYGMAGLYVVQGAPDLALTQFVIETLTVVLFMLVLRHLPERWSDRTPRSLQVLRAGVAALVGVFVFVFALVASDARTAEPISSELVEMSAPEGKGNNVVNVILVDFRGLDTLGEITVLLVAAIGAVSLARVERRRKVRS